MSDKAKILDITMNLNRIGNMATDGFSIRQKRIVMFLDNTSSYIDSISKDQLPTNFRKTFRNFVQEYSKSKSKVVDSKNELEWAEEMMTWGNILTHRAKLL